MGTELNSQIANERFARKLLRDAVAKRDDTGASLARHDDKCEVDVGAAVDAIMTALATRAAPPAMDREAVEITAAMLGEVMQDAWGEICDDAEAHPGDMVHGRGTVLHYRPSHWTSLIALRLNQRLATLSADAIRQGEGSLWKAAGDDAKIGWPYAFAEIEAVRDTAEGRCGDDGTLEFTAEVMRQADARYQALATPASHASDGGEA